MVGRREQEEKALGVSERDIAHAHRESALHFAVVAALLNVGLTMRMSALSKDLRAVVCLFVCCFIFLGQS